jgi:hypothetical protein
MRREGARPKKVALALAVGGVAVFIWSLATASPVPSPRGEAPDNPLPLSEPPPPHELPSGTPVVRASIGAAAPPRWGATLPWEKARSSPGKAVSSEEEQAVSSAAPPPPVLPSSLEERAPDGLPVSAMRCTRTAGGLDCGSCRVDGDCAPGEGCVANRQTRRFECMASECEEDVHCFPGSVCRPVTTGATGSVIRRCVPEGLRREGETCDSLPVSPSGSCREGLRCIRQVCSAPCRLEEPTSCPSGFACTDSLDGPGCLPDCQRLGCPEGQRCSRVRDNHYQCLVDTQGDCQETPCPEGERCNMRMSRGRAVFWCAPVCNPLRADSCAEGQVCGMGSATVSTCFRKCDPMDQDSCGPGWRCATVTEDMTVFGCQPEMRR